MYFRNKKEAEITKTEAQIWFSFISQTKVTRLLKQQ